MAYLFHYDFETRSAVDLKKAGVHRYAEHSSTGIWCMSWRIERDDTHEIIAAGRWNEGEEFPETVRVHIREGGLAVNHNALFERTIWNKVLRRYFPDMPELKVEQQDDTMARAAALGLPLSLDQLGLAIKVNARKDMDGHALMMRMCKPKGYHPDGTPTWHNDPFMIQRQGEYCDMDVEVESLIDRSLFPLSADERKIWQLDQIINDRGIAVDIALTRKAIEVATEAMSRADTRMWYLTDGDVQKCSQVSRLVKWLNDERGIPCESVGKGEIEDLVVGAQIFQDVAAEEAVLLRRAAGKASVGKYLAIDRSVCADGRVRGSLQYHGAHTGRWAGRGIQPQNFPRVDPDRDAANVEMALDLLGSNMRAADIVDSIEFLLGEEGKAPKTLDVLSKCLRAMIIAPKGKRLVGGDFSNVEGRVNAWLAGEEWKLDAFREYDLGIGPDLYKLAYASSFAKPHEDVSKSERQVGKVQELALGYQGGVGAYMNMAANYGIKPWEIAKVARENTGAEDWRMVADGYDTSRSYGLDETTWTGLKIVVNRWRNANSHIMQGWWDLQDAALQAVGTPGEIVPVYGGRVRYLAQRGFLWCSLPSKRVIAYAYPRIIERERDGRKRYIVEYDGVDSLTKRWCSQTLYGGEQCNHVVQGTARDLICDAMLRAEGEGFTTVLTVHDELLCEEPDGARTDEVLLERIMSTLPDWAYGLPLAAATWQDYRYVK